MTKITIISRAGWKARPPRDPRQVYTVPWSARTEFFVHHTAGPKDQRIKAIQDFHIDTNKWNDIGYNFLVDEDGTIYEGRGWTVVGAHCPDHNRTGISVSFIGNNNPTRAAQQSIRWLYEEACRRADRPLRKLWHGAKYATTCPGPRLRAWVEAGMPVDDSPAKPAPKPKPPINPTEALVKKLPTLRIGDGRKDNDPKRWDVKTVYYLLLARDYAGLEGLEDTEFTEAVENGVKGLQAAAGLKQDGVVGPLTWAVLLRVA